MTTPNYIVKSQPDVRDVHVDAILTNYSLAYQNRAYIADKIFPVVKVSKQSDKYYKYPKSFWFRDLAQLRAPATESAGGGYELSTDSYFCENFAFHVDIPDEMRANADSPIRPDSEAVALVTDRMAMRRERAWVSDFFTTGVWATDVVGTTNFVKWSTYGTSDPIVDIETGRNAMRKVTGVKPNTLIMGAEVWSKLRNHPELIERIKYTQKGLVSVDLFASLIDMDASKILIGESIYNTTNEGNSSQESAASFADIWGQNALLLYVDPNIGLQTPTAGITFIWDQFGGGAYQYMRRLRLDKTMSDRIEGHMFFDMKAVATDLGYFFSDVID